MSSSKINVSNRTPEEVSREVAEKVYESMLSFTKAIRGASSNGQSVITIDELEHNWEILDKETNKTYADHVGKELSRLNEKPLIESKKENS